MMVPMRAYIGAATTGGQGSSAKGIVIADVDGARLTPVGLGADNVENPMYLAMSDDGRVLYTVHEAGEGRVSAWQVDDDTLRPRGESRPTGGVGPCHLSIHPSGRYLLTADYGSGSISVHPIADDGSLGERTALVQHTGSGPDPERQEGPHAHMIVTDPVDAPGRGHVLVTDLGTDTVHRYALDQASGQLDEADRITLPPGSGPRHLVINGDLAYVVGELDSTVSVIDLAAGSVVGTVSTSPDTERGESQPSAIRLGPDARFLYVANRGVDEIAVLEVDGADLRLAGATPCGGTHPRDLVLSPDGNHVFMANQFSDDITAFSIDPATGLPSGDGAVLRTPSPACIVFV